MQRFGLQRSRLGPAVLLAAPMVPVAGVVFAQYVDGETTITTAAARKVAPDIDTVTVVGSRIKRAEVEGPAPVTIITRVDAQSTSPQCRKHTSARSMGAALDHLDEATADRHSTPYRLMHAIPQSGMFDGDILTARASRGRANQPQLRINS